RQGRDKHHAEQTAIHHQISFFADRRAIPGLLMRWNLQPMSKLPSMGLGRFKSAPIARRHRHAGRELGTLAAAQKIDNVKIAVVLRQPFVSDLPMRS
ncbi:MAG: hypothetical protein KDB14_26370, partial [Planctomycetales bacterium]|nr:hypothetical protein [Planctomycetales bacterium]